MTNIHPHTGFDGAIVHLKSGFKVARSGWNGKGMWIYLVPANSYPAQTNAAKEYWKDKQSTTDYAFSGFAQTSILVPYGAYIAMKTAQENVVPWLASQTDLLAEDWQIVE